MRVNTEKKNLIDNRYTPRKVIGSSRQSFPKYFYVLAVLFLINIVLGIALFVQIQHYEGIIRQNQKSAQKSTEKAKLELRQIKGELKKKQYTVEKIKKDFR